MSFCGCHEKIVLHVKGNVNITSEDWSACHHNETQDTRHENVKSHANVMLCKRAEVEAKEKFSFFIKIENSFEP